MVMDKSDIEVINRFHEIYYYSEDDTWNRTKWFGFAITKCPLDLWIYQEIIHDTRPDLIIETGTGGGGGALYLAHLLDICGKGEVVTIDISQSEFSPKHDRITYLQGSSTSPEILQEVSKVAHKKRTMVILDSNHNKDHVLRELRAYSRFVSGGHYLIVEDTNVNDHPVSPNFDDGGPMEAVEIFLKEDKRFILDRGKERHFLTFNPKGYLKKIRMDYGQAT